MTLSERITTFSIISEFLKQFSSKKAEKNNTLPHNDVFFDKFSNAISQSRHKNGWFVPEQIQFSVKQWSEALEKNNLKKWLTPYNIPDKLDFKTIGVVMAGNIPLVGFHDLLCILFTGNKALIKTSSNDNLLIQTLCEYLITINNDFKDKIEFTNDFIVNSDAIIATGSNNTARYFEYYFRNKKSIIRKNRNSVAVLTGNETKEQLEALGEDIFRYFGLGCRSVSKLFVPKDYNFDNFFKAVFKYKYLLDLDKYVNNYDYNKAVYLMSEFKMLDNGFLTIKEDQSHSSPIASVFYEFYEDYDKLEEKFIEDQDKIQCVVNYPKNNNNVNFGDTQKPQLHDYADNIDTIDFLLKI